MKCPNCSGEVGEKDGFCEKCGTSLVKDVNEKKKERQNEKESAKIIEVKRHKSLIVTLLIWFLAVFILFVFIYFFFAMLEVISILFEYRYALLIKSIFSLVVIVIGIYLLKKLFQLERERR